MRRLSKINRPPTAKEYNDLVERLNILSMIRGANGINVTVGQGGVNLSTYPPITDISVLGSVKRLKVQENAPAGSEISCKFVDDNDNEIGDAFNVKCDISDGSDLNSAIRRLSDGSFISAFQVNTIWYSTEGFQNSEDCI